MQCHCHEKKKMKRTIPGGLAEEEEEEEYENYSPAFSTVSQMARGNWLPRHIHIPRKQNYDDADRCCYYLQKRKKKPKPFAAAAAVLLKKKSAEENVKKNLDVAS
jgi:hypothetical protein